MEKVINIHTSGEQIELSQGKYKVDILGGWGVELGSFSMKLKNSATQEEVECKKAIWPVQTYAYKKRAKRILNFKITNDGLYTIVFNRPETVRLKRSNLIILSLFQDPIDTNDIEIHIH